jgi:hypothetical protein
MKRKRLSLQDKAMLAMREAVRDVIERNRRDKLPLAVWDRKKQKVKMISPAEALRQFNKAQKSK